MTFLADRLSAWTSELEWEHVPSQLRKTVKLRILDTLGVLLAGASLPSSIAMHAIVVRQGGAAESRLLPGGEATTAALAAMSHGALAHSLDFDDTFPESVVHPSCVIVPVALAVADAAKASGRQLLAASAAGYEVAARLGAPAGRGLHARGLQSTGVFGPLIAAVVAGRLYGLDRTRLAQAMGLAGSMAGGLLEFMHDGSWSKRLHPGWAAHGGIVAAQLAAEGFTGPTSVLEGRDGLYRAYLGDAHGDLDAIVEGLGLYWQSAGARWKLYPCAHVIHAFLDAALAVREEHGLAPDEIVAVECSVAPWHVPIVWEPRAEKLDPAGEYAARASQPFAVAAALVDGRVDLDTFTAPVISRPAIRSLAHRVHYVADHRWDAGFGGRLEVRTARGRLAGQSGAVADAALVERRVREKFRRTAGRVLADAQLVMLEETVLTLDDGSASDVLDRCIRRPPPNGS